MEFLFHSVVGRVWCGGVVVAADGECKELYSAAEGEGSEIGVDRELRYENFVNMMIGSTFAKSRELGKGMHVLIVR